MGRTVNYTVEKLDNRTIKIIKSKEGQMGSECLQIHYPEDTGSVFVLFWPSMHNLKLVVRKHQTEKYAVE
jgi:hypothetical protein